MGLAPFVNNEKSDMPENNSFLVKRKVSQNRYLVRKETVESKDDPRWTLKEKSKRLANKTQPEPGCRLALVHFPWMPCLGEDWACG